MSVARQVIAFALFLYIVLLLGRLVLDWVRVFARDWRPRGAMLLLAEAVYTPTDPPIRALRKVIPPLRFGGMALDLSFMVVMVVVFVAYRLVAP